MMATISAIVLANKTLKKNISACMPKDSLPVILF